jgi:hypothetical protein
VVSVPFDVAHVSRRIFISFMPIVSSLIQAVTCIIHRQLLVHAVRRYFNASFRMIMPD